MNPGSPCAAIVPCLNEARTVGDLVGRIRTRVPTVLVVDDGSTDETAAAARDAGAICIRHAFPRGKAEALEAGFRWADANGFPRVLTIDGDGQHDPADIPAFFEMAERTAAGLVIGNRMHQARAIPWIRRKANLWSSAMISRLCRRPLPDAQCGFRLLDLDLWKRLPLRTGRYLYESEFLVLSVLSGETVAFVPIRVIYAGEKSKIRPVRDTWNWLSWWWRFNPEEATRTMARSSTPP